jgi:eukaryotic-like serine/threonine-protein kinase
MDPQAQAQQRVGATLCNKWTLEKLIGVGGMAAVYVASHKIGRREAIKILHRDVAQTPDLRARFEQEAQVANRFRHPGAVEIRDFDVSEDGAPFLVMELLEGESLGDRARRLGGIELAELLRLADELLDVLAAAHGAGIIHRDIKLDNLFVLSDGRLKVLDFGIARVRDGLPLQMRTRLGATLGTTSYMSPEQIKGLEIDARADLFAVGATLFRIIAKRRIHEAQNETELLVKMASQPAPPLLAVASSTPRDVAQVVDRALMYLRERRYPDAATMQGDVRALRKGSPPPYAAARLLEPDSPRSGVTLGAPGPTSKSPQGDAGSAIAAPAASLSPGTPTRVDVAGSHAAAQAPISSDGPTRAGPIAASASARASASSDGPTRVGPVAGAGAARAAISSDGPTRVGGDIGTRATERAASDGTPIPGMSGRDSPTIQRYAGKPLGLGAEPTLRSPESPAAPLQAPAPAVVNVIEPRAPVQSRSPAPAGVQSTVIMPKSALVKAPAARIAPPPQKAKGKSAWRLILVGGVFMLLGVGGILALTYHFAESDPSNAPSPEGATRARPPAPASTNRPKPR